MLEALLERLNREVAVRRTPNNDDPLFFPCMHLRSRLRDFRAIENEAAEIAAKLRRAECSAADKTVNLLKLGQLLKRTLAEKARGVVDVSVALAETSSGRDILGALTPESLMQEVQRRIVATADFDSEPTPTEPPISGQERDVDAGEDEGEECPYCGICQPGDLSARLADRDGRAYSVGT